MAILAHWQVLWSSLPQRLLGLMAWLLAMGIVFGVLERTRPLRPQAFLRRQFGQDVGFYFLGGILPAYFMVLVSAALAWLPSGLLLSDFVSWFRATPVWLRLAVMVLAGETAYYWAHRLAHEVPWLWKYHAVHHSPTSLDWLVNTRAHPFDLVVLRTISVLPLVVIGLGTGALAGAEGGVALYLTFTTVWAFFIHSNVDWRLGWLEHVIVSPAFHHWHHGNESVALSNRNYASLLPWLDRLFGTCHLPAERFPASYGLARPQPQQVRPHRGADGVARDGAAATADGANA